MNSIDTHTINSTRLFQNNRKMAAYMSCQLGEFITRIRAGKEKSFSCLGFMIETDRVSPPTEGAPEGFRGGGRGTGITWTLNTNLQGGGGGARRRVPPIDK